MDKITYANIYFFTLSYDMLTKSSWLSKSSWSLTVSKTGALTDEAADHQNGKANAHEHKYHEQYESPFFHAQYLFSIIVAGQGTGPTTIDAIQVLLPGDRSASKKHHEYCEDKPGTFHIWWNWNYIFSKNSSRLCSIKCNVEISICIIITVEWICLYFLQ